jgi:hypothetical protein
MAHAADSKARIETETIENVPHKEDLVDTGARDYAGATSKTDPVEIALVRKLDYRIMVSSTHQEMTALVDLTDACDAADVVCDVLPQLYRSKCHCAGASQ